MKERDKRTISLREEGKTFKEIGEELGISGVISRQIHS
jgi:DNA-directed RNA polymerase specialized sigma subunit